MTPTVKLKSASYQDGSGQMPFKTTFWHRKSWGYEWTANKGLLNILLLC